VTGLIKKIPLGTRYLLGFCFTAISGLVVIFGPKIFSYEYETLWWVITGCAVIHWLIAGTYIIWERRWFRFLALAFSAMITGFYIDMSLKIWKSI